MQHGRYFRRVLPYVLLVLPILLVYWPVRRFEFIHLDDPDYLTLNHYVRKGLSWPGVLWAFDPRHGANWHPLTWLSHMMDVQMFGMQAGGHHLTSLIIHVANTLLLFAGLERMTGATWRSAFVAAFFALHPLHVESVAWVAERKDVLSTFFGMICVYTYARYARSNFAGGAAGIEPRVPEERFETRSSKSDDWVPSAAWYGLTLLMFAFALMSKPMLVTLPCLMLLLDYWPLRRFKAKTNDSALRTFLRLAWEKLPFFALALLSSILTFLLQTQAGAVASIERLRVSSRVANATMAYVSYLEKTFWPDPLAIFYPYRQWALWSVVLAALLLTALSVAALLSARRRPYFAVGWFWFLGALVPVIGLIQVGAQARADRYTYLPLIGLFIIIVWGVPELLNGMPHSKGVLIVVGSAALAVCFTVTASQVSHWRNTETLCRHALRVTQSNSVAHAVLGSAFLEADRIKEARAEFAAALEISPGYAAAGFGLAKVLMKEGREEEAAALLGETLELYPRDAVAHYLLGGVLAKENKGEEATKHFEAALRLNPRFVEAHNQLADLLISRGQAEGGLFHGLAALRLDPDSPDGHFNVGGAFLLQGKLWEALPHYQSALRARPDFAEAHLNLGKALLNLGKLGEAESHLREAIRLQPGNIETHRFMALVYAGQKRSSHQAREYAEMLRLAPDWPEVLNNLAWLRATDPDAELRNGPEGVSLAERACDLTSHTNLWLLSTLGAAYAEAGRFSEAIGIQQKVCDLAAAQGQSGSVDSFRERLELYRSGHPYHRP
jgi:tetratricopeptide (TPR) repeat protein